MLRCGLPRHVHRPRLPRLRRWVQPLPGGSRLWKTSPENLGTHQNEREVLFLLHVDFPSDTDISLGDTQPELFTRTRPFPDVGEDEMVIAAVEIGTGMFDGEFANCIGFHNGAYRHPRHGSLMIRGLQLCAPERSHSAAWERARQVKEQAESGSGLRANKELNIEFSSCFGGRLVCMDVDFELCKA